MFNTRKLKLLFQYSNPRALTALEKRGFKEIKVEPTFKDCFILSSYKDITFEETLKLMKSLFKINVLVAMSMVYYSYAEKFSYYLKNNKDELKTIRRKTYKILLRWKKLMNISDDVLYPQNKHIKEILKMLNI